MSRRDGRAWTAHGVEAPSRWWQRTDLVHLLAWASLATALVFTVSHWPDHVGGDANDYIRSTHDLRGSRFPPGFPMLLFPFSSSVVAMRVLGAVLTVALVVLIWRCAIKVAGERAGVAAGIFVCLSPVVTGQSSLIMADAPAAALVTGALLALLHGKEKLAAFLVALSAWFRIVQAALCAALPRRVWTTCALVLGPLLVYNLVVNGTLTGYPGQATFFELGNLSGSVLFEDGTRHAAYPNWQYYVLVLLGITGGTVPGLVVLAALGLRRHWDRSATFVVKLVLVNVVVHLFYFWQDPRFVLPATSLLLVYAAAAFGVRDAERVRSTSKGEAT